MTLADVKRRLQVMRDRGYNANTIRDVEWLIDRVHTLEAEQARRVEWRAQLRDNLKALCEDAKKANEEATWLRAEIILLRAGE
jgi:hypothetical protein